MLKCKQLKSLFSKFKDSFNFKNLKNLFFLIKIIFSQEKAPSFIGKPRILKENKGQRIVFECDCESGKKPDIQWSKNGQTIANQGRFLIDIDDSQKSHFVIILEIDNIQSDDEGVYRCEAKTSAGQSHVDIDLKLNKEEPQKKAAEPEKKAAPAASTDEAANFKEKPKDQVGVDGDKIAVTCKVTGNPKPEITWFKNKVPIKKSKVGNIFYFLIDLE